MLYRSNDPSVCICFLPAAETFPLLTGLFDLVGTRVIMAVAVFCKLTLYRRDTRLCFEWGYLLMVQGVPFLTLFCNAQFALGLQAFDFAIGDNSCLIRSRR